MRRVVRVSHARTTGLVSRKGDDLAALLASNLPHCLGSTSWAPLTHFRSPGLARNTTKGIADDSIRKGLGP